MDIISQQVGLDSTAYWGARIALIRSAAPVDNQQSAGFIRRIDDELTSLRGLVSSLGMCRNAHTPIARLPPEVLTRVFASVDPSATSDSERPYPCLLLISHVCRRWRDITRVFSQLWRHVDLLWGERLRQETLARAGNTPLDVVCKTDRWSLGSSHFELLLHHMRHTRALKLYLVADNANQCALFHGLTSPAPLLEDLELVFDGSINVELPFRPFYQRAPRLRNITLTNVLNFPWGFETLANVVYLSITFLSYLRSGTFAQQRRLGTVLNTLRRMTSLEELRLIGSVPYHSGSSTTPVRLPRLRKLALAGDMEDCRSFMDAIHLPPLIALDLDLHCSSNTATSVFWPALSAHFDAGGGTFHELVLREVRGIWSADPEFCVQAWHGERSATPDLAVRVWVGHRRGASAHAHGGHAMVFCRAVPAVLAVTELLDVGQVLWSCEDWLQIIGPLSALRVLSTQASVEGLCESLAMSVRAAGDTDWEVRDDGPRVFCCSGLTELKLSKCTGKLARARLLSVPRTDFSVVVGP